MFQTVLSSQDLGEMGVGGRWGGDMSYSDFVKRIPYWLGITSKVLQDGFDIF